MTNTAMLPPARLRSLIVCRLSLLGVSFSLLVPSAVEAATDTLTNHHPVIKEIELVHFSHTDVGFTDSPSVCRELYRRYLDIAVDTILDSMSRPADQRFYWTAEATMPVNDWWQAATPARHGSSSRRFAPVNWKSRRCRSTTPRS